MGNFIVTVSIILFKIRERDELISLTSQCQPNSKIAVLLNGADCILIFICEYIPEEY